LAFGKKEEQIFLGREIAQHQDYSEETAIQIDQEVKRLVMANYKRSRAILEKNRSTLVQIAEELLVREVLEGKQVQRIVAGLPLDDPQQTSGSSGTPPPVDEEALEQSSAPPLPPLNKPLPQE
jgi:cell division protease FtsH